MGQDDLSGLKKLLEEQGEAWNEFKDNYVTRMNGLEADVTAAIAKLQRPSDGGVPALQKKDILPQWIDVKSRQRVPVLAHNDTLFDTLLALENKSGAAKKLEVDVNVGRFLRGLVMGGRADDHKALAEERKALEIVTDPSGGYTVSGTLGARWIDLLRSKMVLSQAGALSVPMDSKTLSLARLTADPTVSWRGENAALTASDPTFGLVTLSAKTAVTLVKMSLELAQDSANIEQILQRALTQAMAGAIDSAGLVGVTTDASAAPGGVFNLSGRNSVTSIGAPTSWDFLVDGMYELLADNVSMENIGALIANPAVWKKMRKLKTGISSDNTSLAMPDEIAKLPKLWTTAAPLTGGTTAKGVIADWRDLIFGVRKEIQVRVLQEAFLGTNLQIGVLAYARVDFQAARSASFCTLEGITV